MIINLEVGKFHRALSLSGGRDGMGRSRGSGGFPVRSEELGGLCPFPAAVSGSPSPVTRVFGREMVTQKEQGERSGSRSEGWADSDRLIGWKQGWEIGSEQEQGGGPVLPKLLHFTTSTFLA